MFVHRSSSYRSSPKPNDGSGGEIPSEIVCPTLPDQSDIFEMFSEENWSEVVSLVETNPMVAREWRSSAENVGQIKGREAGRVWKRLPLHNACVHEVPVGLVKVLIEAYPEALELADPDCGSLPLHLACQHHAGSDSLEVLQALLEARPATTKAVDNNGCLPIHCAVSSQAPYAFVDLLLRHDPASLFCPNQQGRTALQCAQESYPRESPVLGRLKFLWI